MDTEIVAFQENAAATNMRTLALSPQQAAAFADICRNSCAGAYQFGSLHNG
jgi:hypothetical protein